MSQSAEWQKANALLAQGLPSTEEEAKRLLQYGEVVVIYILLELSKRAQVSEGASQISPSTPSGMIPLYQKESKRPSGKKKGGAKKGHQGACRAQPDRIDRQIEHRLETCPDCGGVLQRCHGESSVRTRLVEDIPKEIQPEVTEHIIHRDYCPHCEKYVEPKVEEALPKAKIGNRLLVLTAYWHYSVGMTIAQILDTLNHHLHFEMTKGGLIQKWHTLRTLLMEWYEALAEEIRKAAVLHGDETGWRVKGQTYWLWCFSSAHTTYYQADRTRGSPVLKRFFQEEFQGVLVTDFWAAYDAVMCRGRQRCLSHVLTELEKVNQRNASEEWLAFSKKTKKLIKDAIQLRAREDYTPERYESRIERLHGRLLDLAFAEYADPDAKRLAKRLEKHWDELLTFLIDPDVPATNNQAEREIRPAVIMRKVQQGNRSENGALTQSVLMTVFRTLKRRGYNPIDTLVAALQEYIRTGKLPPFPAKLTSNG